MLMAHPIANQESKGENGLRLGCVFTQVEFTDDRRSVFLAYLLYNMLVAAALGHLHSPSSSPPSLPLFPQCAQVCVGSEPAPRTTSAATRSAWAAATRPTTTQPVWPADTTTTKVCVCLPARLAPTGSRAGAVWTAISVPTSPTPRAVTRMASSSMTASACRSVPQASSATAPRGQWLLSPDPTGFSAAYPLNVGLSRGSSRWVCQRVMGELVLMRILEWWVCFILVKRA